jgi:alcohol dehydrogenase YqhD (iron-dependent ADH family)
LRYTYKKGLSKYVRYAERVWNVDPTGKSDDEIALEGIRRTRDYFRQIGAPTRLREVGISTDDADKIVSRTFLLKGGYMQLNEQDVKNIVIMCDEEW